MRRFLALATSAVVSLLSVGNSIADIVISNDSSSVSIQTQRTPQTKSGPVNGFQGVLADSYDSGTGRVEGAYVFQESDLSRTNTSFHFSVTGQADYDVLSGFSGIHE